MLGLASLFLLALTLASSGNASVLKSSLCHSVLKKKDQAVDDLLPISDEQLKSAIMKLIHENEKIQGIKDSIAKNDEWQWLLNLIKKKEERFSYFSSYEEYFSGVIALNSVLPAIKIKFSLAPNFSTLPHACSKPPFWN